MPCMHGEYAPEISTTETHVCFSILTFAKAQNYLQNIEKGWYGFNHLNVKFINLLTIE